MDNCEKLIGHTLQLARRGCGRTSPNPLVGAVLVKNGRIIGEGFHAEYGGAHAEVMAIENARESVEGADLYCNLEPCCHDIPAKHTPPCTQRIINEKIRRVFISTIDPNPYVSGKGVAELRNAGIEVHTEINKSAALKFNEAYFKFIQTHIPFVHLKIAQSLDGRIATKTGDSRWITDESARREVHKLRHHHDAVLVGKNTVLQDDPSLTVRLISGKHPKRIVLDSHLEIPLTTGIFQDGMAEKTFVFTTPDHPEARRRALEGKGVQVRILGADRNRQVVLKELLACLGELNVSSVLVEGGSQVFTAFIRQKLFDKISIFMAPILLGNGREAIGELNIGRLAEAISLEEIETRQIGDQLLISGYRNLAETLGKLKASN